MDLLPILFVLLAAYSILAIVLNKNVRTNPSRVTKMSPKVSIIIACKNEEQNLPTLFQSLKALDYPQDKLEIIIIDDDSQDRSAKLIERFAEEKNIHALYLRSDEKIKPGKAGALLAGIDQCNGEFIFITDADCQVPRDWLHSLLAVFEEGVGVVGGYTFIDRPASTFEKIQALDWQFLLSIASASSQLDKPITWVGNNLAIRKNAYDQVGGYRNLPDSVVEDFALIDAIERQTSWSCRFYTLKNGAVKTQPLPSLLSLYQQRKRWAVGISGARPFGLLIMSTAFLTHLGILAALFTQPLCAVPALLLKLWSDCRLFSKRSSIDVKAGPGLFLLFQIYYIAYSVLLPFLFLFDRRIVWKGQELNRSN